jgi:chromosome partitioning protein
MICTVTSFKGGVGKTTAAVHLAAFLQNLAPTLLVDGDPNRSASRWASKNLLPFRVVDERQGFRYARDFANIVIDTQARPELRDLQELAEGCDLLVIPTTPDLLGLHALLQTVEALESIQAASYKVLLSIVPPLPDRDGEEARTLLQERNLPHFGAYIRRLAAFKKAVLGGVTVGQVKDPRAKIGWGDFVSVGEEIIREQGQI